MRNEDDGGSIAMAEKVDYLKHASLGYPLNELGMSVFRVDDAGSLHIEETASETRLESGENIFTFLRESFKAYRALMTTTTRASE